MKALHNKQRGFRSRDLRRLRPSNQSAAEAPGWTQPRGTRVWCIGSEMLWVGGSAEKVFGDERGRFGRLAQSQSRLAKAIKVDPA